MSCNRRNRFCIAGAVGILLALALPVCGLAAGEGGASGAFGPAAEIAAREAQMERNPAAAMPENPSETVSLDGAGGRTEPPAAALVDVNMLEAAQDATQLLVVIGNKADPAQGNLTWYQRGANGSLEPVWSGAAVSGMNGISAEKAEGDKKTPAGVYHFSMAFGLKENPGTILPYHQIVDGDHYVDDSGSRYYNRLVNEKDVVKDWNSSEVLVQHSPQYNYGLVIDYNEECIPGKGSAIFLHCPKASNNTGTSGCISIPEDKMKEIACSVDAGTKIIIVQEEADLAVPALESERRWLEKTGR